MIERITFMQLEDDMVTFEKENGDTIIYPNSLVPQRFKEGDIINAIVHNESSIDFFDVDHAEMNRRRALIEERKSKIRIRARQNSNLD